LNIRNPREIKTITINAENDAISGTNNFFFFFLLHDSFMQRSGLSSTLKEVKGAYILLVISLTHTNIIDIFALSYFDLN